jgi:hypothetical protein
LHRRQKDKEQANHNKDEIVPYISTVTAIATPSSITSTLSITCKTTTIRPTNKTKKVKRKKTVS